MNARFPIQTICMLEQTTIIDSEIQQATGSIDTSQFESRSTEILIFRSASLGLGQLKTVIVYYFTNSQNVLHLKREKLLSNRACNECQSVTSSLL